MSYQPEFISHQVIDGEYYYLDLTPDPTKGLSVVCGGRETCGAQYLIERNEFPFSSIEFVESGHGQLVINGDSFPLESGTLFRYGPGIAHRIQATPGSTLVKSFVDFQGLDVASFWEGPWQGLRPLHVPESSGIRPLFADLHRTGRRPGPNSQRLCSLLVQQLVWRTADEAIALESLQSTSWQTYRRCKEFIESHYLRITSLAAVCDACHVGSAWLCRLFTQFDSETPYQFLMHRKMTYAASLLSDPKTLVKQAAVAVGFDDPYHFSRVFKRVMAFSPEAFRTVLGQRGRRQ